MPDVVVEQVRKDARHILDPGSTGGKDLPANVVDDLKYQLVRMLEGNGYKARKYFVNQYIEAIAYVKEDAPFRQEPILLDDGGSLLPSCVGQSKRWDKIFKIAIRDANGKNKGLHDKVKALIEPTTGPLKPCPGHPGIEGTIVYGLNRFTK